MMQKRKRIKTAIWAFGIAWRINKKVFVFWATLSISVSVLPAIALKIQRDILSIISKFIMTGDGSFKDVFLSIILLGIILTISGLAGRLNGEMLYILMFDYYYLGMEEYMMDSIQQVDMKTLHDKEYIEEYRAILKRAGSLNDLMSSFCILTSKLISIIALLLVAINVSFIIFAIALLYTIGIVLLNILLADKAWMDYPNLTKAENESDYYQKVVMKSGVAKELRIYNNSNEMEAQWEKSYQNIETINKKNAFWKSFISLLSGAGFYIFLMLMIIYSVFQVMNKTMTVDVFLMLYLLGQSILQIIETIAIYIHEADRGLYALQKQHHFITSIPRINNSEEDKEIVKETENIVFEAKNLYFSYDNKNDILKDLSFKIHKGETIALVGSNGSGKSTLIKLLIELYQQNSGELFFYGKPYTFYKRGSICNSIGVFFQDFYLFHATLRENIGFGDLKEINNNAKIEAALKKAGGLKIIEKINNGLNAWLLRTVKGDGVILSGGEKQKIAVARAHMSDKDILIFDEPAAALDPIAEVEQFQQIQKKIQGRTAILISHRIGFARLADRIIVLQNGRIAENGTHEELMKANGVYCDFFIRQAEWYDTEVEHKEKKCDEKAEYEK